MRVYVNICFVMLPLKCRYGFGCNSVPVSFFPRHVNLFYRTQKQHSVVWQVPDVKCCELSKHELVFFYNFKTISKDFQSMGLEERIFG